MAANRVLGVLLGTTLGTSDTPLLRCEFRRGGDLIFANPPHTHTHTVRSSGHIQVTLVSSIFCSKSEPLFIAEGRPGHREHRNCAGRALSSSTGPSPFRVHLGGGSAERGMSCPSACPQRRLLFLLRWFFCRNAFLSSWRLLYRFAQIRAN